MNTRDHHEKAFADRLEKLRKQHPRRPWSVQLDNEALDPLRERVTQFRDIRTKHQTSEFRATAKAEILDMVLELNKTCPPALMILDSNNVLVASAQSMTLAQHVAKLKELQEEARSTTDPEHKQALQAQSLAQVDTIIQNIHDRREAVQEKRPRLDPKRLHVLVDVRPEKYVPFATALAHASIEDRKSTEGQWMFAHTPALDQLAKKTECFLAMLEFSTSVKEVLDVCRGHPKGFWNSNRAFFQDQLNQAADKFNAAIPRELRMRGDDPSYTNTIKAEEVIRACNSPAALRKAHAVLKDSALTFVMGSHEQTTLFNSIKRAYLADKRIIGVEAEAHEQSMRRQDGEGSEYQNPLKSSCSTLNLVYEARWALAADVVHDLVKSYRMTLADSDVFAGKQEAASAPSTRHADKVTKKATVKPTPSRKRGVPEDESLPEELQERIRSHEQENRQRGGRF